MGFSTSITLSAGANSLNGRGILPALSSISSYSGASYPIIALSATSTAGSQLTAYLTGVTLSQTQYNGSPTYVALQNGIFTFEDGTYAAANTYPYKLVLDGTNIVTNTLAFRLSATGVGPASGLQTATLTWALSSTALSGTSAGTTIPVTVTNNGGGASITTDVYAAPTNYVVDGVTFINIDEFLRRNQVLNG